MQVRGVQAPPLRIDEQTVYFHSSERQPELGDGEADLCITSPPYWNLKDYEHPDQIGQGSYEEYLKRTCRVLAECSRVTSDRAVLVVNVGNRRVNKRFYPIAFDLAEAVEGWELWDVLIWHIPNALPQPNHYRERLFDSKYEFLLVFTKDGGFSDYTFHKPRVPQKYAARDCRPGKLNPNGRCLGNIFRIPAYRPPTIRQQGYHVAAYPEELAALLIETFSEPGDLVLDPFAGSGTTLKVANACGRRGVGYELNAGYRQLLAGRIAEPYELPDWRSIDLISSSAQQGPLTPRPRRARRIAS